MPGTETGQEQKELAELVIKKILDGYVFFLANDELITLFETENLVKFERTAKTVRSKAICKGEYMLYFIKNDDAFKSQARSIVLGAGSNFHTLLGFIFEFTDEAHVHVIRIGDEFDLDRLSEMVYDIFTEKGTKCIREVKRSRIQVPHT